MPWSSPDPPVILKAEKTLGTKVSKEKMETMFMENFGGQANSIMVFYKGTYLQPSLDRGDDFPSLSTRQSLSTVLLRTTFRPDNQISSRYDLNRLDHCFSGYCLLTFFTLCIARLFLFLVLHPLCCFLKHQKRVFCVGRNVCT